MTEPSTARRLASDLSDLVDLHTHAAVLVNEAATYILAQEKAMNAALYALESITHALPAGKSTVNTCYAINNIHRDMAHEALKQIKELQ